MADTNQNLINQEQIVNTRKEHWNTLFCWIDFSKTKWKDKVYNKEQQFWQMPNTFVEWQKEVTKLLIKKHGEIEKLVNSFRPYLESDIYPLLKDKFGDKSLLFRCERLLDNKMIGETSSLFPDALSNNSGDLVIFEIEYRQQQKFKELLPKLSNILFTNETINNQWKADLEKMKEGKVSYSVANNFWIKWGDKIENQTLVQEVNDYLKLWQKGKGATSQWKDKLKSFAVKIDDYFTKKAGENLFFQIGIIKRQAKWKERFKEVDGLIISTQNRKGWDLLNPYLMLFWFHQKPQQENPLAYRAYFVNNFNAINPRNLYIVLDLQEDWIWKNYSRALLSAGSLKTISHPIYHERNLPANLPDKKLHFFFCDDLGDKEVYYLDSSFQPRWQLFTINHPNFVEGLTDDLAGLFRGKQFYANFYESPIKFPSNIYKVERYDNWWTGLSKGDIMLLLLPEDFYEGSSFLGVGTKVSSSFYEKRSVDYFKLAKEDFTTNPSTPIDPKLIKEINDNLTNYNHLVDHSTFQFCFNQDTIFSANLRYLNLKKEEGELLVKYILKVKATPAGTYYTFLSGNILWQLRIEVKQTVPSGKTLKNLLTAAMVVVTVTGAFMLAGALGIGGAGLADGAILNSISGDLSKIQQANQLLQSAKSILPEENGNISFSFSLFDFWAKLRKRPFWGKIYVSNNLKNNLIHNNNENPATFPLNITFDNLWKILRKGEYQGNLKLLGHDPGKYLSNKFKEGIIFFEDRKKDFITPDLGLKQATNLLVYNLANAGGYIGEEIKEFVWIEKTFDYNAQNKGYSHSTYLTVDNSSVRKNEWKGLNWNHWDDSKGWCWGCTQEKFSPDGYKGNAHDPNSPSCPPFAKKEVGKFTPSQDCTVEMKLHVDGSNTIYENLKGGTEYTIAVDHQKIYFGYLKTSGTKFQEIPNHDSFGGLDWQPTTGVMKNFQPILSEFNFGEGDIPDTPDVPEEDPTLDGDVGGGEPEVFIEPDISIEPDVPENEPDLPEPEVPEPEITPPEPETPETDPTPDTGDPEVPDNDIPNNDNNDYD